jgi:hypothetical protein
MAGEEEILILRLRTLQVLVWPDTSFARIERARRVAKAALLSEHPAASVMDEAYKVLALADMAEIELKKRVALRHRTGGDTLIEGFLGSIGLI